MSNHGMGNLIADVDDLLTDSKHPLDEQQARRMSLMLLRQVYNEQLIIQRDIADWKVDMKRELGEAKERARKDWESLEARVQQVERMLPWVRGLAWFVGVVGVALVGAVVRYLFG